jgi:hypothetical protein
MLLLSVFQQIDSVAWLNKEMNISRQTKVHMEHLLAVWLKKICYYLES